MMPTLTILLCLLPSILLQNTGPSILFITSNPDSVVAPIISSTTGGTLIYIKAIGHNPIPSLNQIYVGSLPCIIPDEGIVNSFITCYTSATHSNNDLFNSTITLTSYSISFTTGYPNVVNYVYGATPQLSELFPSCGFANYVINFQGIHAISQLKNVQGLYIGSDRCILQDPLGVISPNTDQFIPCKLSALQVAGMYDASEMVLAGSAQKGYYIGKTSETSGISFDFIVLPTITAVSRNTGNLGGQRLIISGTGFSPNIDSNLVTIDGNVCAIESATNDNIICNLSQRNGSASSLLFTFSATQKNGYIGGGGLQYVRYGLPPSTWMNLFVRAVRANNLTFLKTPQQEGMRSQLKQGNFYGSFYGQVWKGYFTAPTNGTYTFTGISDDIFAFYLNPTEGTAEPPTTPLIYSNNYNPNWQNFYISDIPTAQASLTLTSGRSYYIQAYHMNYVGPGNFKINVNFPPNQPQTADTHQIDKIALSSDVQPEVVVYSMVGGSGGLINLKIVRTNPVRNATIYQVNATVAYGCSSANFLTALNLFNSFNGYQVTVVRNIYDASNNTLNATAGAARIDYVVSVYLLRPASYSNETFNVSYIGYFGQFEQYQIAEHSPLVSGTFSITIGSTAFPNIPYNASSSQLQACFKNITGFQQVQVSRTTVNGFQYAGSWTISYFGVSRTVNELSVDGSNLTGGSTIPNLTLVVRRAYSTNINAEPVDARFLSVVSSAPAILVKTNGLKAVCLTNCLYNFTDVVKITSMSLTATGLALALISPIVELSSISITVQGQPCMLAASSTYQNISCDLPQNSDGSLNLVAGDVTPQVYVDPYGYAYLSNGTLPISIPLNANLLQNTVGENNGGHINMLYGNSFPSDPKAISITICNASAFITTASNTNIQFHVPVCPSFGIFPVIVSVVSLTNSSLVFEYLQYTNTPIINSIYPLSANPYIKTLLEINGSGFATNLSEVQVFLSNSQGVSYTLSIIYLEDNYIQAGLAGGNAGIYTVQVVLNTTKGASVAGLNNTNQFQYLFTVFSISPQEGSYFGGTVLTIIGQNFVKGSTTVYVGSNGSICSVQTINETEITCRMPALDSNSLVGQIKEIRVSTMSKGFNTCSNGNCSFTYYNQTQSPSLISISQNSSVYHLSGYNFLSTSSNCSVRLNSSSISYIISPDICTDTSAQFQIPADVQGGKYSVAIVNQIGQSNFKSTTVFWIPGSPNYSVGGSIMGTIAQFIGGAGYPSSLGGSFNILLTSGSMIYPVNILSCCQNNTVQILIPAAAANTVINITFKGPITTTTYSYKALAARTPSLVLVSNSTVDAGWNTIMIMRTDSVNVSISSIKLISTVGNSVIDVANWTNNGNNSIRFNVFLYPGAYSILALTAQGFCQSNFVINIAIQNSVTIGNQVLSFAGGQITLSGSLISPSSYITINSLRGELLDYTNTTATYAIPPFITLITDQVYNLASDIALIRPSAFLSDRSLTTTNASAAFDSYTQTIYGSSNTTCFIGIDVGQGLYASLDRIRYFPYIIWQNGVNRLLSAVFQASNDLSIWEVVGVLDQTVHTGWNNIPTISQSPFRYFRFRHNTSSNCNMAELEFYGRVFSDSNPNLTSHFSNVSYYDGFNNINFSDAVEFREDRTPIVYEVVPAYGDVYGGYDILIKGANLGFGLQIITIDQVLCELVAANDSQIICKVGTRSVLPSINTFAVTVGNCKAQITKGFVYISKWSDIRTWDQRLVPIEGDIVEVPAGMTLFMDQNTPLLEGIVVNNGILMFSNETDVKVRAKYITINGGKFIAGTQENPLHSNLQFIMHGTKEDSQHSLFGNKGIGCLNCMLSIFGMPRMSVWTNIALNIYPGDTNLTVSQDVDWKIGQSIVVASTNFSPAQSQKRIITAVYGRVITVDTAFAYTHHAISQQYISGDKLQIKAQVGLLTRNIKIMGDESSMLDSYGSHLMVTSTQALSHSAHIAYVEFTRCGQPLYGKHCIYFNLGEYLSNSFVRGNSIYQSFSRAISLHSVHYLTVDNNIAYRVKGNNFFMGDGIQSYNILSNNLAISSLSATNLQDSDATASSFWISNPTNSLIGNHAAGADYCGITYQIRSRSLVSIDACPVGYPLSTAADNIAHSNRYCGFRIVQLLPRTYPCVAIRNDNDLVDPWRANPSVPSVFSGFTIFRNQIGVISQASGNIKLQGFTVFDNSLTGLEFYLANFTMQMVAVSNSIVAGGFAASSNQTVYAGVITPRSGKINISNTRFYNFPRNSSVIVTCSKCNDTAYFTNLGNDIIVYNISFQNIKGNYVTMFGLKRDVLYDLDASLSPYFGGYFGSSATLVWGYNHIAQQNSCKQAINSTQWGSLLLCDQTITIRRVFFTNIISLASFNAQDMKIIQLISLQQVIDPLIPSSNYTSISGLLNGSQPLIEKPQAWSLPFITGRLYHIWWGSGIDFTHLSIVSPSFLEADLGIIFKFNYTNSRQAYSLSPMRGSTLLPSNYLLRNKEYPTVQSCLNGEYYHNNDDSFARMLTVCQSGKNRTALQYTQINVGPCDSTCLAFMNITPAQNFVRLWSNATQWPGAKLPSFMQNVTVPAQWTVLLDVNPAIANYMLIDGAVIADDTRNVNITARSIFIRAGSITAGSPSNPFKHMFTIQLIGNQLEDGWYIDPVISGNKYLVVTGRLNLYGTYPINARSTLTQSVFTGDTSITVANSSQWNIGDSLVLSPSYSKRQEYELVTIKQISNGSVELVSPLKYNHYGSPSLLNSSYGTIDLNTQVGHVSLNVQIVSGPDQNWGLTLVVYGFMDGPIPRTGSVTLSGVLIKDSGQPKSSFSALQFLNLNSTTPSTIIGSFFLNCQSWCININNARNIIISDNTFYKAQSFGVQAFGISHFVFQRNLMMGVTAQSTKQELVACFATYEYINPITSGVSIKDNYCLGSQGHGFVFPHIKCGQLEVNVMANNTAGSCQVGFIFNDIPTSDGCKAFSYIKAYGCEIGQSCNPPSTSRLVFSKFVLADNQRAGTLSFAGDSNSDDNTAALSDSYINAVSRPSCTYCYGPSAIPCQNNIGLTFLSTTTVGSTLPNLFGLAFDPIGSSELYQGKAFFNNVVFENYRNAYSSLAQCGDNFALTQHSQAKQKIGDAYLVNSFCNNCEDNYLLINSSQSLCGDSPCTGKNNYLVIDWTGSFLGQVATIIPKNNLIGANEPKCIISDKLNAFSCNRTDFAVLAFQSQNYNVLWPVSLSYLGASYTSLLNVQKSSSSSISIFSAIIKLNTIYTIFFSSVPVKTEFQIQKRTLTGNQSNYIIIQIQHKYLSFLQLNRNGTSIDPIIVMNANHNRTLNTSQCGDNIYYMVNSTIQFVVTETYGCSLTLTPVDNIRLVTVFATTIELFLANNAVVSYLQRLSVILNGMDARRMKVVGIKSGSVILQVIILGPLSNNTSQSTLLDVQQMITNAIDSGFYSSTIKNATGFDILSTSSLMCRYSTKTTTTSDYSHFMIIIAILAVVIFLVSLSIVFIWWLFRRRVRVGEMLKGSVRRKFKDVKVEEYNYSSDDNGEIVLEHGDSYEILEASYNTQQS